jgi:hypothetical protein
MLKKIKIFIAIVILLISFKSFAIAQEIKSNDWWQIKDDKDHGISGTILIEKERTKNSFLVVHDNKFKEQPRFGIIFWREKENPQYIDISIANSKYLPVDLEAITIIPEQKNNFLALASNGNIYQGELNFSKTKVSLFKKIELPSSFDSSTTLGVKDSDFESFALQKLNEKTIAVWAERGKAQKPATIYWGVFDLPTLTITPQGSTKLTVPFPIEGEVRHISDLKIDPAGVVYISSASDGGNNGPFQSAIYIAGSFYLQDEKFVFQQNLDLVPLGRFEKHKIEAIELVSGKLGGLFLGTDDENLGAFLRVND